MWPKKVLVSLVVLASVIFPFAATAATVDVGGTISADTAWSGDNVYRITADITVNPAIRLTIAPGAILKFSAGKRIYVNNGTLSAVGESGNKIVFTSYRDDSQGGDTNGGGPSTGNPGDWRNIYLTGTAGSQLEHVIIRYGGSSSDEGSLNLSGSNLSVLSSEISHSSSHGVRINDCSPLIEGSTISANGLGNSGNGTGIYLYGSGSPTLRNNTISGNYTNGIFVQYSPTPTLEGNTITGNGGWGVYFEQTPGAPEMKKNTITGNLRSMIVPASALLGSTAAAEDRNILGPNTINGVWIRGNGRSSGLTFERLYAGQPHEINTYQIYDTLTMNAGATLTVAPGVVVKFYSGAGLTVHGALSAVGTAPLPVVFTSWRDDRYGGDLNLDGYGSTPVNGDWGGIYFSNQATDASCLIDHGVVRYGGSANSGMIYSDQTNFTIQNSVLSNSASHAIRGYYASLTLSGNEIFGNSGSGVYVHGWNGLQTIISGCRIFANFGDGITVAESVGATVTGSEIFGNQGYGLRDDSSQVITATGNWWGAESGPYHATANASGAGDQVSGNVDFSSFLTDGTKFNYFNAGPNLSEGTIAAPTVIQGTDTTEFGTDARTRMLYDLEKVILDYGSVSLPAVKRYRLFVTYANGDNTSAVGGNIQRLTDGDGLEIHGRLGIPGIASPTQYNYDLMPSSHDDGKLKLQFIRESGYRAVVSQVWLVERPAAETDMTAPTAAIGSPAAAAHVSGTVYEVTGTSADGAGSGVVQVEVGIDGGSGVAWYPATQVRSDGSWSYRWTLPSDGSYTLSSRARDRAGNLGVASAGVAVVVNNRAPSAPTGLSAYDTPLDGGGSISLFWALSADDNAGAADVTGYEIQRSEQAAGTFGTVGSVAAGATSTTDTTATTETLYYYRVRAVDRAGNRGVSAVYGPVKSIVNTGAGDPPEDVTGLTGTPGNGFVYLSWTRSANTALDLVDQILERSTDGSSWGSAVSLGKEAKNYLAASLTNGQAHYFRIRVKDSSDNLSVGSTIGPVTPNATAVTTVSGTIGSDTTWSAGVYRVSSNITVNANVTLTILPGVIVKFGSNIMMTVNGTLNAVGAPGNPVVFTAWTDDSVGGDSNGDAAGTTPAAGYWDRLQFNSASGASRLENVVVQYGGSGNVGNIYINQADVPVISSQIRYSSNFGIRIDNSSPLIEGNTVSGHASHGIYIYSGSPTLRNNAITGNTNGIYSEYAAPLIDGNTITSNSSYGIYFNSVQNAPEITGNTITGNNKPVRLSFYSLPGAAAGNTLYPNTTNQIEFYGNSLTRSLTLTAGDVKVYYQVGGVATVSTGVKLTVSPGVIWKFADGSRLDVNGGLYAVGTAGNKIVFTSYRDDSQGGDTNGGGYSVGQPGDWNRISFSDSVVDFLTRLEHVIIRYGGSDNNGSLNLSGSNLSVLSSEISHSSSHGVRINDCSPLIEGSKISANGLGNSGNGTGIYLYGSGSPTLRNNVISGNYTNGIFVQYSPTPTLEGNTITGNGGWGVYFEQTPGAPEMKKNTITGNLRSMIVPASALLGSTAAAEDRNILGPNTINGVWIRGNGRSSGLTFERLYAGQPHEINTYQIYDTLTMNAGATLTVSPGVVVKFYSGAGLTIHGALSAVGTSPLPVVFTSWRDDRYGGDLNLDGYGSTPVNGDWRGIYFSNTATDGASVIDHGVVRYGGSDYSGMIYSDQTNLTIQNSVLSNSASNAIRSYYASLTVTGNEIFGNSGSGFYVDGDGNQTQTISGSRIFANFGDGIRVGGGVKATVTGSEIFGNQGYGLRDDSSQVITATGNWWGADSGPYHATANAGGAGDQVSGNADFSGFLTDGTEFSYFDAGGTNHYGYGILSPVVSGTASTEWGAGEATSFLYNLGNQRITAEYMGLSWTSSYRILLTYLNKDAGGGIQSLTDISGETIHPSLVLPTASPVSYDFPVGRSLTSGGNLTLHLNGLSGLRTVVSGIFLLKDDGAEGAAPVVHLSSPITGSVLKQETISVSGTVSDAGSGVMGVEVGIQKTGETIQWTPATTIMQGGWTYRWTNPSAGGYTLKARSLDHDGNRAVAPETVIVTVDGSAPGAATDIFAQGVSGTAGRIRVSWTPSADDGAGAGDVLRYEIFRSESLNSGFAFIGQVGAGTLQFTDATVITGTAYYYNIAAVDRAGYRSNSQIYGPVSSTGAADTTPPEDVTGLTASATQISGASPSVLLTWTGSTDSAGDLVDQRLYQSTDGGTTWSGAVSLGQYARRYQVVGLTAGLPYLFKITAVDAVPNESAGATISITPSGALTETISLSGTLAVHTTLSAGVYKISDNLTVPAGVTLALGPGAVVKFASGRMLTVNGTLNAVGTVANPVVFTAWTDDSYGGDSNGDASGTTPAAGYWGRLQFNGTAGASRLENVVVQYGGSGNYGNIYITDSNVPVILSEIRLSSNVGVYIDNSSPLIEGNTVGNNASQGIYIYSGSPTLRNNTITGSANGIHSQYGTPLITGNTITGNSNYGVYFYSVQNAPPMTGNTVTGNLLSILVPASALPDATNVLAPNTRPFIGIRGNDIGTDKTLPVWGKGTVDECGTYLVYSSGITVPAYKTLSIDPGVTMKFASGLGIVVNGVLAAGGSLSEKIVFTSLKDDIYGGDTNDDGNATIALNGDWNGITFNDSFFEQNSLLNHVKVRYAGGNGSAAVYIQEANIRIENSEISNSSTNGIRGYSASPVLTGNNLWGNSGDGIRIEYCANAELTFNSISSNLSDGIEVTDSSNTTALNNRIFMNRGYGILNNTSGASKTVDATQCWWGESDASGPYQATTNTGGTGNKVSNNVLFSNWVTTPATAYSYVDFASTITRFGPMATPTNPTLTQGLLSDAWGTAPDRTMAYYADGPSDVKPVIVDYTGLVTSKRYKARISYFNADPAGSVQSLADGSGAPIHGAMIMPTSTPVQYEFTIPTASYMDGNLRLQFIQIDPDQTIRVAVPEIWLMEDIPELTPPRFVDVDYNDANGSATLDPGDEYYFHFSEEMNDGLIANGTTDANQRLVPTGNLIYGTVNQIRWSADKKTVIVTITDGFTVTGNEAVTTNGLLDLYGNLAVGSKQLSLTDTIAPAFTGIGWVDADSSSATSLGDRYVFHFNETMKTSVIQNGTQAANLYLRPAGGTRYGQVNTVSWSGDGRDLTVTVTDGYTIIGNELVIPSSFVTDVAGNAVTGAHLLVGRDSTAPTMTGVTFDDADGSQTVSVGDSYRFDFSEPVRASSLSNGTTEANTNLSPGGGKYGSINKITWNAASTSVRVEITAGFTVLGHETVTPAPLVTDRAGNPVSNTINLILTDTISPEVSAVKANYISPVSATGNYKLLVQFNSSMKTTEEPLVTLASSSGMNPVVPAGGAWLTTRYANDTYATPDIALSQGMDGTLTASVSGAQDKAGNVMSPAANVFSSALDATPPQNPAVTIIGTTCSSANLSWAGYTAPADLSGFQVYRSTAGAFNTVDGKSFVNLVGANALSFEAGSLALDTQYHLAVAAIDRVGNFTPAVTSLPVLIAQPVPPLPSITVSPGADPHKAIVSWGGYDSSSCGFAGFKVYVETAPFGSVAGLTAAAVLDAAARQYVPSGLDRSRKYYIAVIAANSAGAYVDTGHRATWSDPYANDITTNLTIGGGEAKEIAIYSTMTVKSSATLTIQPGTKLSFAPGTGITVEGGKLLLQGTALKPITLTSNKAVLKTAAPGDWEGLLIGAGDTGSILQHVIVEYGKGLTIAGTAPQVDAFTASYNSGAGLLIRNGGALVTTEAFLRYNAIGAAVETGGDLMISNSVIKNNTLNASNASAAGTGTMAAPTNWWGIVDKAGILSTVAGSVTISDDFLTYEPVLTPAIGTAGGGTEFSIRTIELVLAGRNAEEMRLSENSLFAGVFFDAFKPLTTFTLSPIGGNKTIFAQFNSPTGTPSETVSITVKYVTEGPSINSFSLSEGQLIQRPIAVTAGASALLGVQRLEFYVDDVLTHTAASAALNFSWDIRTLTVKTYRVKLLAYDNGGNFTALERNIQVNPQPPPAPQITQPTNGLLFNSATITVRGSAEAGSEVKLMRNGFVVGTVTASAAGIFEIAGVTLQEGNNQLIAVSQDSVGVSPSSNTVTVMMDSGAPPAPTLESATARAGVGVDLGWKALFGGEMPSFYRLYRGSGSFTNPAAATLIGDHLTATGYTDKQITDGVHFYGVVAVDGAGNPSLLSNLLSVSYDGTAPSFDISYTSVSPTGAGILGITLTASEPLAASPTLTIRPCGANTPVSVSLTKQGALTYTGSFEILTGTCTGPAMVSVSGTDLVGNKVSGTPAGTALVIDTDGPVATVSVGLPQPVQVMAPVNLGVQMTLNEAAKTGSTPLLQFIPPVGSTVTVALSGSNASWNGTLPLHPAMGSGIGTFTLLVFDELGNESGIISAGKTLEIYNTAFPNATGPPTGLKALSKAAGVVELTWSAVDKADSYKLYRRAGDCSIAPNEPVASGLLVTNHQDTPPSDGAYCYAVSTDRRGAESELSTGVAGLSDRTPPNAPESMTAVLGASGVRIGWNAPAAGDVPARYFLYRNGVRTRTVQGGASSSFTTNDYPAAGGSYTYLVTAGDAVGNESTGASTSFDLTVGAVANLQALVVHGTQPELNWTSSDSSATGFNIYRGRAKLNATPLTETTFKDLMYSGLSRVTYGVTAVKAGGNESPQRTVDVYPVELSATANPDETGTARALVTRYFNRLVIRIANKDAINALYLNQMQLKMTVNGEQMFSLDQNLDQTLAAGATHLADVVLLMDTKLDAHILALSAIQAEEDGSRAIYRRDIVFEEVINPSSMVTMNLAALEQLPLAGGYSKVNVCVNNRGTLDMDVIVSRNNGNDPGDIHLEIKNEEGLVISQAPYKGTPDGAIIRTMGTTRYVRIPAGGTQCVDIQVLVPESLAAGAQISFVGVADAFYYNLPGAVSSGSGQLTGTMPSGITLSEYYGTAQADRNGYADNDSVVITGKAIDRQSGLVKANTPLKVGLNLRGFTWFVNVTTDGEGNYSYTYSPTRGIAGEFICWAAHPDVYDIIDQDRFSFHRLYTTPIEANIRSSKADTLDFEITLINPGDVALGNFSLQFRAYTLGENNNEVPVTSLQGGAAGLPSGFQVAPGEKKRVPLSLSAAADAPDKVNVEYRFVSAQGASAVFYGTVSLVAAVPVLTMTTPAVGYIEASVNQGALRSIPVTVKNQGLIDLANAQMTLPRNLTWVTTNLQQSALGVVSLGTIGVGQSRTFDVVIAPPANAAFGDHNDKFVISGSNSVQQLEVNVYALVTSQSKGTAQFTVYNNLGQKVKDATVRIFNNVIHEQIVSPDTDVNGEVVLYGLTVGDWTYQINAPGHSSVSGVVTIVADQTALVEDELDRSLITITFNVQPVAFTDRYEIKIEQKFDTHVPVPVLVWVPSYVDLGVIKAGYKTTIMTELSNKGLKALDNVTISTYDDGKMRLEPLITYMPRLGAMETVEVPVQFTYRGQTGQLPGGVISDCAGGGPEMDEVIAGLAAIAAKGATNSYLSAKEKAVMMAMATGAIIAMDTVKLDIVEAVAEKVGEFLGCVIGTLLGSADSHGSAPSAGAGTPSKPTYGTGTGGPGCFVAGTPVMMADGSQQDIASLRRGDRIRTFNGGAAAVINVYERQSDHVTELHYLAHQADGTPVVRRLETTDEHQFWVMDQGRWKAAAELVKGDRLAMPDGGQAEVVELWRQPGQARVYSLDVAEYESFYANGVLARQQCGPGEESTAEARLREFLNDKGRSGPMLPEGSLPGKEVQQ